MTTKNDIFSEYLKDYLQSNKIGKGGILDLVCAVTKMHRKAAIRKFWAEQRRSAHKIEGRGRAAYFTPDVTAALKEVREGNDEICGELLHPVIAEYVAIQQRDKLWRWGEETTRKLLEMSERTMKRRVSIFQKLGRYHHGVSATKPSALKRLIPIFKGPWKDLPPGHGQVDTVAHCGNTLLGDFIYTTILPFLKLMRNEFSPNLRGLFETFGDRPLFENPPRIPPAPSCAAAGGGSIRSPILEIGASLVK